MNSEQRSAKLWAILQFPLTRILIAFGAIVLFAFSILVAASAAHLHGLAYAAAHLLSALVAWGVYVIYVRRLERRSPVELALSGSLPQLAKGFGIGVALYCVTVGILWLSGAYGADGLNPAEAVFAVLVNSLGAALLEEIAVRGVLFRIMEGSLGTWIALGISALIFGLLHGINPGANWISITSIAVEAGTLLAATYVYARQLWIGIGLHWAWNFSGGGIFGGEPKARSLLAAHRQGADWLSGGQNGLDASLVTMLLCLAVCVTFLVLAQRRGHIMAPFWKRK